MLADNATPATDTEARSILLPLLPLYDHLFAAFLLVHRVVEAEGYPDDLVEVLGRLAAALDRTVLLAAGVELSDHR